MGTADKMIRIIVAIVLLALYFTETISGTLAYVGFAVAGIFLLTGLINFCPLYTLFGIKTCKTNV